MSYNNELKVSPTTSVRVRVWSFGDFIWGSNWGISSKVGVSSLIHIVPFFF
jgi:arginine decarboxylase-like protein